VSTTTAVVDPRVGRSLFDPSIRLPAFVLRESALAHDIAVLADFCRDRGVSFAPHGKTTMAPAIFRRQVEAGAWAITVAHPWQAEVAAEAGIERVLIANEIVDDAGLDWIGGLLDAGGPELLVLVDSVVGVQRMAGRLAGRRRPLAVLIDVGMRGGRTGVRTVDEAEVVARAVVASPGLRLAGVSLYEGVVGGDSAEARETAVRAMTTVARAVVERLEPLLDRSGIDEIVVTGGGSTYPDVVADELHRPWPTTLPVRVVLRSGAYVTHDHGIYERGSPFGLRAAPGAPRLEPAIEVWAPVVSAPEPGLAIAGAGRRDLPIDQDLPVVHRIRSADGGSIRSAEPGFTVTKLNDQHAFIALDGGAHLAVGDLVGFGISHPCTAFQLWREALVIDDADRILDIYELRF
jgi:D-serine deaminase-like pyridoxal phosphate-dependent protein